jgi:hypothetical protein
MKPWLQPADSQHQAVNAETLPLLKDKHQQGKAAQRKQDRDPCPVLQAPAKSIFNHSPVIIPS